MTVRACNSGCESKERYKTRPRLIRTIHAVHFIRSYKGHNLNVLYMSQERRPLFCHLMTGIIASQSELTLVSGDGSKQSQYKQLLSRLETRRFHNAF